MLKPKSCHAPPSSHERRSCSSRSLRGRLTLSYEDHNGASSKRVQTHLKKKRQVVKERAITERERGGEIDVRIEVSSNLLPFLAPPPHTHTNTHPHAYIFSSPPHYFKRRNRENRKDKNERRRERDFPCLRTAAVLCSIVVIPFFFVVHCCFFCSVRLALCALVSCSLLPLPFLPRGSLAEAPLLLLLSAGEGATVCLVAPEPGGNTTGRAASGGFVSVFVLSASAFSLVFILDCLSLSFYMYLVHQPFTAQQSLPEDCGPLTR